MVLGPDNMWIIKAPKTPDSIRDVELPDFVAEKFRGRTGQLVRMDPDTVTRRFSRALKKIDVPRFRFHDLRHYGASIMHAIGIPDQYIMQRGGWASDNIMKTVYRNVIDLEAKRNNRKINQYFSDIM